MESLSLQNHLLNIANNVTKTTTIEDVFEQFLMFLDIEKSEKQIEKVLVFSHKEVKKEASEWLK